MEPASPPDSANFTDDPVDVCTIVFSPDESTDSDHFDMISKCLRSIVENTDPRCYRLWIGCNNASARVMDLVESLGREPHISYLVGSPSPDRNGHLVFPKYPLMRRLYAETRSPWLVWFDDDSYVTSPHWLRHLERAVTAHPDVAQFGKTADVPVMNPPPGWIENASWYNPDTTPQMIRGADGSIRVVCAYVVGGFYALRRDAMVRCHIPDPRLFHNYGDWTTGLALKHQGFKLMHYTEGVAINTVPRRGIHDDAWSPPGEAARLQREEISRDQRLFGGRAQSR